MRSMKPHLMLRAVLFLSLGLVFATFPLQTVAAMEYDEMCIEQMDCALYDPNACAVDEASDDNIATRGSNNEAIVWNYFTDRGLTPEQVAGIMGNMARESGFDPQIVQGGSRSKDPSSISSGWGLIQWTPGSKIIGIARDQNVTGPIYEIETQLLIVWNHMKGTSPTGTQNMLEGYKKITTKGDAGAVQATNYFEDKMEGAGVVAAADRQAAAKAALKKYGSGNAIETAVEEDGSNGGCSCTPDGSSVSGAGLSGMLDRLADDNGGKTTIAVATLDGSLKDSSGGDAQMPTRSSYKIYTAYATLHAIEAGDITWSTKTSWNNKTVEETMEAMIVRSDNDAAEALRTNKKIGSPEEVTSLLQEEVGLSSKTAMGSGKASDARGSNTQSTANDFVKFLTLLDKQRLPGVKRENSYTKLLSYMKRATTDGNKARDGIVAGVGGGVDVADKPGWAPSGPDSAANDVGIVYAKSHPYVIAIMSDKPAKWDGVANIAKQIHAKVTAGKTAADVVSGDDCGNGTQANGDITGIVKSYAWPDYHAAPYLHRQGAYAEAVARAKKKGQYVGGSVSGVPGIDCGGFVTRVMIDSGFEPNYNYKGSMAGGAGATPTQQKWLDENWQKINPKSTKDMQPGDVAVNSKHTYVYVGKVDGFNSTVASASYSETGNGRAPMAGRETPADSSYSWYRKK